MLQNTLRFELLKTKNMAVNSINDLRAVNPATSTFETVLGFDTPGDGGGGDFYWKSYTQFQVVPTDNTGTIIQSNVSGYQLSGRWIRLYSGPLNVKWFGAKGDWTSANAAAAADDTLAIQKALNIQENVYFPKGVYKITSGLIRGATQESGYPVTMDTEAIIKPERLSGAARYTALRINPKPLSEGWSIYIDTLLEYELPNSQLPQIDGILFEYSTLQNISSIRVNGMLGYGLKFNRMYDTYISTISVEKCGSDNDYAVGFYTSNNDADTVNESFIARLQTERSYKKAIYVHPTSLNVHFGVIHSERIFADSSATTWDFGGANCTYGNIRLTAQAEAFAGGVNGEAKLVLRGDGAIYNGIRAENDPDKGGSIKTYLEVNQGSAIINNLNTNYLDYLPGHNSIVVLNKLIMPATGIARIQDLPGTIIKGGNIGQLTVVKTGGQLAEVTANTCVFENVRITKVNNASGDVGCQFRNCLITDYSGIIHRVIVDNCVFINEANFEYTPYFEIRNSLFRSNLKLNFFNAALRYGKLINSHVVGNLNNTFSASGLLNIGSTVDGSITANLETAPTVGLWKKGDRHYKMTPAPGQPKSWVRTASGGFASEGNL